MEEMVKVIIFDRVNYENNYFELTKSQYDLLDYLKDYGYLDECDIIKLSEVEFEKI